MRRPPPNSGYQRSVADELVTLLPDFMYGIALVWLYDMIRPRFSSTALPAGASLLLMWTVGPLTAHLAIANAGWLPVPLTVAAPLLALVTFVPAGWIVSEILTPATAQRQ